MKYIDADILRKEIEKKYNSNDIVGNRWDLGYDAACKQILEAIDSLQQEQPSGDLEVREQIEELANDWHHKGFASDEDCPLCMQDLIDILWHFYKLGKQWQKEQVWRPNPRQIVAVTHALDAVEEEWGYEDEELRSLVADLKKLMED